MLTSLFPDLALLVVRCVLGYMFACSGFHKLFVPARHARLVRTLTADRIPFVGFMQWWVPGWEFVGGVMVILGVQAGFFASILGLISLVALASDGIPRIKNWAPLNRCDWVCCLFYLPETLLGVLALVVILCGPGSVFTLKGS